MNFLRVIQPRFRKVWSKPIQQPQLFPLAQQVILAKADAPAPFPGKRKTRWVLVDTRRGVVYEGKPSKQAIYHAQERARDGEKIILIEFDKANPYCLLSFAPYNGEFSPFVNIALWQAYHKISAAIYFSAIRRKSGIKREAGIKAR
jgi:hypothetical protein